MTVWFTSDLHFRHEKVAGLRGFDSTKKHDDAILDHWHETVREDDQVWVLGDLSVSNPVPDILNLVADAPGVKHLIAGNHDGCHPMNRRAYKAQADYLWAFDSVQPFARRKVNGESVLLSHFPYVRDRGEPRYTQWRLPDEGLPLLHGHTHGEERLTVTPTSDPTHRRIEIHVGWDAWGRLVSLDEVAELLRQARQPQADNGTQEMLTSRWAG